MPTPGDEPAFAMRRLHHWTGRLVDPRRRLAQVRAGDERLHPEAQPKPELVHEEESRHVLPVRAVGKLPQRIDG